MPMTRIYFRPDDVLQTVKFGEDVLQQMRAKRNEILTSHGISQKPPEPKVVKLSTQEKIIIPSSKVSDQMASRQKDYEDQLSKVASEFDDKLGALHSDMTEMMMTQKAELEAKMREIVSAETGQLRKEFRMERDLQVSCFLDSFPLRPEAIIEICHLRIIFVSRELEPFYNSLSLNGF